MADNEELITQVRALSDRVADLEDRLSKAKLTSRRTFPSPEYSLYVPKAKGDE